MFWLVKRDPVWLLPDVAGFRSVLAHDWHYRLTHCIGHESGTLSEESSGVAFPIFLGGPRGG